MPQSNRKYWRLKIAGNVARDRLTNFSLKKAGWRVLRVWEHSLKEPSTVAHRIISRLSAARNQCIHTGGIYERRT
jgi:DNA mismatch endonuclease (patch repair protein)